VADHQYVLVSTFDGSHHLARWCAALEHSSFLFGRGMSVPRHECEAALGLVAGRQEWLAQS